MIHSQTEKHVVVLTPAAAVATDATATGRVDCADFAYAAIDVIIDSSTAGTDNPGVLKITEGTTTTAADAITELTGDGVGGFTIPDNTQATPAGIVRFNLDLRKRKRYLKLSFTPTKVGGQLVAAVAHLSRANQMPNTATEAGVTALVNV